MALDETLRAMGHVQRHGNDPLAYLRDGSGDFVADEPGRTHASDPGRVAAFVTVIVTSQGCCRVLTVTLARLGAAVTVANRLSHC